MKRSFLPQLLAAPAVAGVLLFSFVDSAQAQAKGYTNNNLISSTAVGIFFGMAFSSIATYLILNLPNKDSSKLEKAILNKFDTRIDKLNSDMIAKINNVDQNLKKYDSDMTIKINKVDQRLLIERFSSDIEKKINDVNQDISKLLTHVETSDLNTREYINGSNENFQARIADAQKAIEDKITSSVGEIRAYIEVNK